MTVEEFYAQIDGDYEAVTKRIHSPEKIVRFVNLFLNDTNYKDLEAAIDSGSIEDAFKAAHNLKGVSANLAFSGFYSTVNDITEALRAGDFETAKQIMPTVTEKYRKLVDLAQQL